MSIRGLRFIDFWLGLPLTWIFTFFSKTFGRWQKIPRTTQRLQFIKFSEQGSTVIARQILLQAAETYGRENLFFVVFKENKEILNILDLIPNHNIWTIETKNIWTVSRDLSRVILKSWRNQVDTVIDLEFTSRASALLSYLTGAGKRVGLFTFFDEGPSRGDLFTHRVQFNPQIHTASLYLAIYASHLMDPKVLPLTKFKLQDLPVQVPPILHFENAEIQRVRRILQGEFKTPPPPDAVLIVMNVNASDLLPIRKWPEENFLKLASRLLETLPSVFLLFTGNGREAEFTERLIKSLHSHRAISLAGKLSLREFIVLLSQSDLLISNDSGPAHFSSLTDVHRIVLFGPETPNLFKPLGSNLTVIYEPMACSPCVSAYNHRHSRCADNVCMKAITVEWVFSEAQAVLQSRGGRAGRKFSMATSGLEPGRPVKS